MDRKHNKELTPYARELRKHMTKEEKHLWYDFLKGHSARFTRQKILGHYILDFFSPSTNLAIELDGSQHYTKEAKEYDQNRTAYLEQYGIKVLRFLNSEINKNFNGVCQYIDIKIDEITNKTG